MAAEIHQPELQKLVAAVVSLPEETFRKHRYALSKGGIEVSTLGLSRKQADSLAAVLSHYVGDRFAGHSARYALDVLRLRVSERKPEKDATRAILFRSFPDLPPGWVQAEPFRPATVQTTSLTFDVGFIVVDNGIAWTYWVSPGTAAAWRGFTVDAQEYDPALRVKFEAARKEAEQNLAGRGVRKDRLYSYALAREMDEVLVKTYGIRRKSFRALNPGVNLD